MRGDATADLTADAVWRYLEFHHWRLILSTVSHIVLEKQILPFQPLI